MCAMYKTVSNEELTELILPFSFIYTYIDLDFTIHIKVDFSQEASESVSDLPKYLKVSVLEYVVPEPTSCVGNNDKWASDLFDLAVRETKEKTIKFNNRISLEFYQATRTNKLAILI